MLAAGPTGAPSNTKADFVTANQQDSSAAAEWVDACAVDDIDHEDLIAWTHGSQKIAIYRTEKGFFATALFCTHFRQNLEMGIVIGCVIECPLHGGRFDLRTGKALSAPVSKDIKTYPVKVEGNRVFVQVKAARS